MNNYEKPSLLAMANSAMKEGDYARAIHLYKLAGNKNPKLLDHLKFNISLAEKRLLRQDPGSTTSGKHSNHSLSTTPAESQTESTGEHIHIDTQFITDEYTPQKEKNGIFALTQGPTSGLVNVHVPRDNEVLSFASNSGQKITPAPRIIDDMADSTITDYAPQKQAVVSISTVTHIPLSSANTVDLPEERGIQAPSTAKLQQNELITPIIESSTLDAENIDVSKAAQNSISLHEVETHSISSHTENHSQEDQLKAPAEPKNIIYSLIDIDDPSKQSIRGHIDVVDENFVHGWISDLEYPENVVSLDLYIDNNFVSTTKANILRKDVSDATGVNAECGFRLEHGKFTYLIGNAELRIYISNSNLLAFPQAIEIGLLSAQVTSLSKLAKIIKRELVFHSDPSILWLSSTYIPKLMEKTRNGEIEKSSLESRKNNHLIQPRPERVSVVIPVYEGYEETINCINSVLEAKNKSEYNLIVVNDCSPNQKLTQKLRRHSQHHGYYLLENEINRGFVGTVNRGMRTAEKDDIILLNSDTLVPDGWLDQLVAAAYSDPIIGTVTPFSNNATICSYPNFCQDNQIPAGHNVNSLNLMFQRLNKGAVIDLPTAHGFCVFIKRATINEIGLFDEQKWGKGYAEENDFSLRAEQRGWRNVFALDTFVQHLGSVSFASNTEEFVRKNLSILNGIYPDYAARVSQFIHNDPARKFRNTISKSILENKIDRLQHSSNAPGNFILFVSLTIGGGTQIATDDISRHLAKEGAHSLMLTCPSPDTWRLSYTKGDVYLDYKLPDDRDNMISDLKLFGVWHINYHNTIEFNKDIWALASDLDCQYDVTIHDYLSVCPRVNLINETRQYCGEPASDICNTCVAQNGAHESSVLQLEDFNSDINIWRSFYEDKLESARKVFVPSEDLGIRLAKYFKNVKFNHRPHPEPLKNITTHGSNHGQIINVAFLGAIGVHKGYDYLKGCATHALSKGLPLKFHVIGYTKDDTEIGELKNVTLHGQYKKSDLHHLLRVSECTVAAILSVWPETYSYTLSEALDAGLKVLTFDLGAPAERLPYGAGSLANLDDSFETICTKLINTSMLPSVKICMGKNYGNYLTDYYDFSEISARLVSGD